MKKTFCTYSVKQPAKPVMRMAVAAPLVEAALVTHEGEVQPALILEDGQAIVLSFAQIALLHKLFKDWANLFDADAPRKEDSKYKTALEVS